MKASKVVAGIFSFIMVFLIGQAADARSPRAEDRTLSPYFFIKSDDPANDSLPLKSTKAIANISGVIADVTVVQEYKNSGSRPIEAIYIFPASTRAAVYGMKMTIGKRVLEAKLRKRNEARQEYEEARQQGRNASLLEQQRPNVFQMNVANIMPGDKVRVELKYTEVLVPEDRIYEFVYPTVVGPRYSNQPATGAPQSERWVQNPYLHEGESPNYTFDIQVNIAAGLPVRDIYCPSHKVAVSYDGQAAAGVRLNKAEQNSGNRDYILRYRLAGDRTESGLLLYKGENENFFLLMMQPPKKVSAAQIPAREYIFIVDVSGSMHGFPLEISKKLIKDLISNLRTTDRFNLLLFAGGSSVMSEHSLPATSENITAAINLIDRQRGGGGTELLPALKRALDLPRPESCSRTVVIATDGYVTVEEEVFDLIRKNLGNANMFSFGIGTSVNRHIIEGMARVGMGEPFVITNQEEAADKAEAFRKMISSPVLTQIKVNFDGFDAYDVEPPSVPDMLADRPVIIFGKWRGTPRGRITLKGISGGENYSEAIDPRKVTPSDNNSALRYLWARHKIGILSDYNSLHSDDGRIREVTDLGLKFGLLTAYTSFVATDTEIRNATGSQTTVKQPLPMPHGVSDYAIGRKTKNFAAGYGGYPETDKALQQYKVEERSAITIHRITISDEDLKNPVEKEVRKHLNDVYRCYAKGHGKVEVTFTINPDGSVSAINIDKNEAGYEKGSNQLMREIKKWLFPKPAKGEKVKVTISFIIN